ncbi:MAG: DNA/RNA non-specific endonuclease [Flavobacteriaceae bacterium]|nr:DNA/RNA non-specific endonuclease [Flavobacteriaceae bacterium]
MKKTKYIVLLILVISILFFAEKWIDKNNETSPETSSVIVTPSEEFSEDLLPTSTTGVIIHHTFFALSYAEKHEQAEWVAYELKKEQLSNNEFERPYFVEDKKIKTHSADWRNYKNSGYDRGHLCPAGDRRFSYDAYNETFLTSNISPQNRDFNAGVWNYLEQKVRFWAEKYDGLYVVTGGVLKEGLSTMGEEEVSVPEEFFKIVLDASGENYKVLAFLIPNEKTTKSFYDFVVSVDEIEEKTGIDFFSALPDAIEDSLESQIDLKSWGR